MKFEFQVNDEVEPRLVRAMLMRGYYAFKAAFDDERKRQELHVLHAKSDSANPAQYVQALEKLRTEEELWKQLLVSLTRSE